MIDSPGHIPWPAAEELLELLGQFCATDETADARYGRFWRIYGHPSPAETEESFNLLLQVAPSDPRSGLSAQGLPFVLRAKDEPYYYLSRSRANWRGQTWFSDLPAGTTYHAWVHPSQLVARVPPEQVPAAFAARGPAQEKRRVYQLAGGKLRADLEESPDDGRAVLTVSTQAPELAEAEVRFRLGKEAGVIVLKPSGVGDLCEGTRRLNQMFVDAIERVPEVIVEDISATAARPRVDRRARTRYPLKTPVQLYHGRSRRKFTVECVDVSGGGMLVSVPGSLPMEPGDEVQLTFGGPARPPVRPGSKAPGTAVQEEPVAFAEHLWRPEDANGVPRGAAGALLEKGKINLEQLDAATKRQKEDPRLSVLDALVEANAIDESTALQAIATYFNLSYQSIRPEDVDKHTFSLLDPDFIKRECVLPIRRDGEKVLVGISDPADIFLVDEVKRRIRRQIQFVVTSASDIRAAADQLSTSEMQGVEEIIRGINDDEVEVVETKAEEEIDLEKIAGESPVIRYVNYLIVNAASEGASDIHIEPGEERFRIRYQIDGIIVKVERGEEEGGEKMRVRIKFRSA